MSKIYLPTDYVNNSCKVVNNDYIRVYTNSTYTNWVDVYFKSDYMLKSGSTNYSQNNVVCDSLNTYTDNIYYRYDFCNIIIIFFILLLFCFYFPYKIIGRMFGRWLRI